MSKSVFYNLTIVFLLIVTTSCTNTKKKIPNKNLPPKYAFTSEPEFKHQGNLQFININDTVCEIKIEVADTYAKREKGLMYRKTMKENRGMLFIFPDESRRSFWMKETHIPLDIIFVNSNKEINHIVKNCKPYSLKGIQSFEYAQYVVEVNAGYCNKHSVKIGYKINFLLNQ